MTSSEVYKRMQGNVGMSMRMVRVLMNRLNQKDILGYTVDEHDSRVYHYYVQRSREECVKEKSRKFVDSYFSGNGTNAMAALLQSFAPGFLRGILHYQACTVCGIFLCADWACMRFAGMAM